MNKKQRLYNSQKSKILEFLENSYIGEIVDIDDPRFEGRVKVQVWGIFNDGSSNSSINLGKLDKEDIAWGYPYHDLSFGSKTGTGKFSTPRIGTKVRVIFQDDINHYRYIAIETINDELKKLLKDDYNGFHSLIFDSDNLMKVYFAKKTGFIIDFNQSLFNILPDNSILLKVKGGTAMIELNGSDIDIITNNSANMSSTNNATINSQLVHVNGVETDIGSNPIYDCMNGNIWLKLIQGIAVIIDAKLPTGANAAALVKSFEPLLLSKTVKTSG